MTPHAPTMADQVGSSYAESAMLQERSDTLHRLASDLRAVATRLTNQATELDDLAYCRRRAAFEASRGSLASASKQSTLARDGKTITERLEEAAEAVRAARTIKKAAKPLIDGGNAKRQITVDEFPDKPCTACSQIINPLSAIADRFAERLLQERERQGHRFTKYDPSASEVRRPKWLATIHGSRRRHRSSLCQHWWDICDLGALGHRSVVRARDGRRLRAKSLAARDEGQWRAEIVDLASCEQTFR